MGYDAGYYSYAWCDAVAADLAEHFEVGEGWPARPGNGRNKLEYDGAGLGLGVWTT
jgi:Zn-dependent oligopeptidase